MIISHKWEVSIGEATQFTYMKKGVLIDSELPYFRSIRI